jgi:DNA-binding response OmpR family regulator
VSGRSSSEDLARGKEVGASAYFVKPLDLDALIARIRALVPGASPSPTPGAAPSKGP